MGGSGRAIAAVALSAMAGGALAVLLGAPGPDGAPALRAALIAGAGAAAAAAAALWVAARAARALPGRPAGAGPGAGPGAGRRKAAPPLPAGFGRYLLDQLPVGLMLVDGRGRVQLINPAAARLFGHSGRAPFHVSALRAPRFLDAIEAVRQSGRPAELSFSLARAEATHLKATVEPLPADTGEAGALPPPAVLVALEDHTRARRAEELHRDFVANASHELKTPLASISGIIETLTGHARDDPAATERFLGLLAAEAGRMQRLVADLLSLNRIELNERIRPETPQPLRRIVHEVASGFAAQAEAAGMRIDAAPPADLPSVLGDREELAQLFANLIDNAVKYGRPGTAIEVRVLGGGPGDGPGDARVGIAVRDRGHGIAREHLPRLTERFYRVSAASSRAKGGTGLGLAIVKHIVARHQGELAIESTPGEGSTFTVWLPVHRAAAGGAAGSDAAGSEASGAGGTATGDAGTGTVRPGGTGSGRA